MREFFIPRVPQQNLLEKFYTFLTPVEDRHGSIRAFNWRTDPVLKRSFRLSCKEEVNFLRFCQSEKASDLVQYFLGICQDEWLPEFPKQLARWHLAAYLEAPAYKATKQLLFKFKNFEEPQETWNSYLHIAKCLTNNPKAVARIYQRYDRGSRLEEYFQGSFLNEIRDIYYAQTGNGKYSPFLSLKRASRKTLIQGLKNLMVKDALVDCYLTARDCLFEVYSKSGDRWLEPTPEQYQQASVFCTHHYYSINSGEFKRRIQTCISALQSSLKIDYLSEENQIESYFFESHGGYELSTADPLLDLEEKCSIDKMQTYVAEMHRVLVQVVEDFKQDTKNSKTQEMLLLRYGLDLSESITAPKIGINQSTVSRRCQRLQRQLLRTATVWLRDQLNLDTKQLEKLENSYIDIWLKEQYNERIYSVIKEGFENSIDDESREILRAKYFDRVPISDHKLAKQMKISLEEVKQRVVEAKHQLLVNLLDWVNRTIGISLDQHRERRRVEGAIERWLTNS